MIRRQGGTRGEGTMKEIVKKGGVEREMKKRARERWKEGKRGTEGDGLSG